MKRRACVGRISCSFAALFFLSIDRIPDACGTPIFTFNDAVTSDSYLEGNLWSGTFGFAFAVYSELLVTGLGWYDEGGDGLVNSYEVGIWDGPSHSSPTNLLLSATIPSGTDAPLDGQFRTVSVPTYVLGPGTYIIGGFRPTGEDPMFVSTPLYDPVTSVDPRVGISIPLHTTGSEFTRPNDPPTAGHGWFGPSFSVVPEPSSALLLVSGLLSLAALSRRGSSTPLKSE